MKCLAEVVMDMYDELRAELVSFCRLCYARGHVAGNSGNISARTRDGEGIVIKSSGVGFHGITPDDMLFVDWKGAAFDCRDMSDARERGKRASVELCMHLSLYSLAGETGAVIHLHSPYATAMSVLCDSMPLAVTEARCAFKRVPVIPEHPAGSRELASAVREAFLDEDVCVAVLKGHGPVARGRSLQEAYNRIDMLEHNAHVAVLIRSMSRIERE